MSCDLFNESSWSIDYKSKVKIYLYNIHLKKLAKMCTFSKNGRDRVNFLFFFGYIHACNKDNWKYCLDLSSEDQDLLWIRRMTYFHSTLIFHFIKKKSLKNAVGRWPPRKLKQANICLEFAIYNKHFTNIKTHKMLLKQNKKLQSLFLFLRGYSTKKLSWNIQVKVNIHL